MASKKYDIVAKVGEYTDQQGNQKPRWQNIGAVLQGDKAPFIIMEPWVNLSGLPHEEGRGVLLNLFDPNSQQGGGQAQGGGPPPSAPPDEEPPF